MTSVEECFVLNMALRMICIWSMLHILGVCRHINSIHDCNIDIEHGFSIYPVVADSIRLS